MILNTYFGQSYICGFPQKFKRVLKSILLRLNKIITPLSANQSVSLLRDKLSSTVLKTNSRSTLLKVKNSTKKI